MGDRGFNAGGFAWMDWRTCKCGPVRVCIPRGDTVTVHVADLVRLVEDHGEAAGFERK